MNKKKYYKVVLIHDGKLYSAYIGYQANYFEMLNKLPLVIEYIPNKITRAPFRGFPLFLFGNFDEACRFMQKAAGDAIYEAHPISKVTKFTGKYLPSWKAIQEAFQEAIPNHLTLKILIKEGYIQDVIFNHIYTTTTLTLGERLI